MPAKYAHVAQRPWEVGVVTAPRAIQSMGEASAARTAAAVGLATRSADGGASEAPPRSDRSSSAV